jgi:hypothetical protein
LSRSLKKYLRFEKYKDKKGIKWEIKMLKEKKKKEKRGEIFID